MKTLNYYIPGILLILGAVLIVVLPEILVAFAASILTIGGIAALIVGHKIRKAETSFQEKVYDPDGHPIGRPGFRFFHYKRYDMK